MSVFKRIRKAVSGRSPSPPSEGEEPATAGDADDASRRRGLAGWVESRAKRVASDVYQRQADDLETRARRVVSSAYEDRADDLEERAVRAMRTALAAESDRIKEIIEHAVAVKKREVRLSLVVLISAALIYFALDWLANRGGG